MVCQSVSNRLSLVRAKRVYLRPSYHIGLDWIGLRYVMLIIYFTERKVLKSKQSSSDNELT